MLNLGNVYASVGLDHSQFDRGVQRVGSGVDTIVGHLGRIGDLVIGVTLAQSLENLLGKLTEIPRKLVDINAEMETIGLGMAAHLDNASKLVATSIEEAGGELAQATHRQSLRLSRVQQDIKDSFEDLDRRRGEVNTRRLQQGAEVESEYTRAAMGHARRTEDIQRSQAEAFSSMQERGAAAMQTLTRQTRDFNERFNEGTAERARSFNQSMADIQARQSQTLGRLNEDMQRTAEDFTYKVADASEKANNRLAELAERNADNVEKLRIDQQQGQENFSQDMETRASKLSFAIDDINQKYADGARKAADESAKAAADFGRRMQDIQYQATQALNEMRLSEERQSLRYAYNRRQLERQLRRAGSPEQREELQDRLQLLDAEEALRRQGVQQQRQSIEHRRNMESQEARRNLSEATGNAQKQLQAERKTADQRIAELQRNHAFEVASAQRTYIQRQTDLERRVEMANKTYARETADVQRELNSQLTAARRQHDQRVASLQSAINREMADTARQTANMQADYAARESIAQAQHDRNLRNAGEQYEKEVASAHSAYERITRANDARWRHEQENYEQHTADIERRSLATIERIENESNNVEIQAFRRQRDLNIAAEEALREYNQVYEAAAARVMARNAQVANMFSAPWIESTNRMLDELAKTNPIMVARFEETGDIMERQERIMQVLRESSFALPGTFQEIAKSAQQMMGFGLDPFEKGLYRIVAGLSLLPGAANVGTSGIIRAFGQLRAGATGQAERVFREIGVPLRQISGLVFNAAGEMTTALPEAWDKVLAHFGPKTDTILRYYQGSWKVLFSNLQEIFENFMRIAGKNLFDRTKQEAEKLYSFISQNSEQLNAAAGRIGNAMGGIAQRVFDFAKRMGDPVVLDSIQRIANLLQGAGENVLAFMRQVSQAAGLSSGAEGILSFVEVLARGFNRFTAILADPDVSRQVGLSLQYLGQVKDEFLDVIGALVDGLIGRTSGTPQRDFLQIARDINTGLVAIREALAKVDRQELRDMAAGFADFARGTIQALGNLVAFMREHGDELKTLALILGGFAIAARVVAGINAMVVAFGRLGTAMGPVAGIARAVATGFGPLISNLATLSGWFFGSLPGLVAAMARGAASIISFGGGIAGSFGSITATVRTLSLIFNAWTAMIALRFVPVIQLAVGALGSFAGPVGAAVVGFLGGPLTAAILGIIGTIALVVVAWNQNWGDIQGKAAAVGTFINETVVPLFSDFKDGVLGYIGGLRDDALIIIDVLKSAWDVIVDPWIEALGKLSATVKSWFVDEEGNYKIEGGKLVQAVINGMIASFPAHSVMAAIMYNGLRGIVDVWDRIGDEKRDKVLGIFKNLPLWVIEGTVLAPVKLVSVLADMATIFKDWADKLNDDMKDKFKNIGKEIVLQLYNVLIPGLGLLLKQIYGSGLIGDWVDKLQTELPNRMERVASDTVGAFRDIVDGMRDTTENANRQMSLLGSPLFDPDEFRLRESRQRVIGRPPGEYMVSRQNMAEPAGWTPASLNRQSNEEAWRVFNERERARAEASPVGFRPSITQAWAMQQLYGPDRGSSVVSGGQTIPGAWSRQPRDFRPEQNYRTFLGAPMPAGYSEETQRRNPTFWQSGIEGAAQREQDQRDAQRWAAIHAMQDAFEAAAAANERAFMAAETSAFGSLRGMIVGDRQKGGRTTAADTAFSELVTAHELRGESMQQALLAFEDYLARDRPALARAFGGPQLYDDYGGSAGRTSWHEPGIRMSPTVQLMSAVADASTSSGGPVSIGSMFADRIASATERGVTSAVRATGASGSVAPGGLRQYTKGPPGSAPSLFRDAGGDSAEGATQINNFNAPVFNNAGAEYVGALVGESWRQFVR